MSILTTSQSDKSNFEITNEVTLEWANNRLKEICRCITIFMKYLLIPHRPGYKVYSRPQLNLSIVKYVVEEIFNCGYASNLSTKKVYPEEFAVKTKRLLRHNFPYELLIDMDVIEYLWNYISCSVDKLTEGLSFSKELKEFRSTRKRLQTMISNEDIKNFKKKLDTSDENTLKKLAIKTVGNYRHLISVLKKEIEMAAYHIKNLKTNPDYIKETMGINFDENDIASLNEFGVKPKLTRRIQKIYTSLNDKKLDNKISRDQYMSDCIILLSTQEEVLQRMLNELRKSKIGVFLRARKKNKNIERIGDRDLLDKIYASARERENKWKRTISKTFKLPALPHTDEGVLEGEDEVIPEGELEEGIPEGDYEKDEHETGDYGDVEVKKIIPKKAIETVKWIRGDEDMGDEDLKISEEIIEQEYINFNTRKEWRDFLKVASDQLLEQLKEIDTDESLINLVSQRIMGKIKTRIDTYQTFVSMRECDHKLDDDMSNCFLQSMVYLSITISDWLEINNLGVKEFKTALQILLPDNLKDFIDYNPISQDHSRKFTLAFDKCIQKYKLSMDNISSIDIILSTGNNLRKLDINDKRYIQFNNRLRYFANSLIKK